MDDGLKEFLEKFAELERRVRKLAVEDRALREEVSELRGRLFSSEEEAEVLKETLDKERRLRKSASRKLANLINRLERLKGSEEATPMMREIAKAVDSER